MGLGLKIKDMGGHGHLCSLTPSARGSEIVMRRFLLHLYWTILKHYPETRLRSFSRSKVFFVRMMRLRLLSLVCVCPAHLALYINCRQRSERKLLTVVPEDEGFMDWELKGVDQG